MGLANAFLSQGSAESRVLAAAEFEDFLRFYPTSQRADEAQYGLAMTHFEQIRAPERDQTETRAALAEFEAFMTRFPNSALMPEAQTRWRAARDRLSESVYLVGRFYYNQNWMPGAIDRFEQLLDDDPDYTSRDAVYFYLAESHVRADNPAEAVPYLERLLAEFDISDFRADAELRLQELTVQ
jgi:outer membrane protein assembly factor BamD